MLTIIKNNRLWNAVHRSVIGAHPDGATARANAMPLTSLEPAPHHTMIAAASRAHTERALSRADLPGALREDGRQAVLDVAVALSDPH